MSPPWGPGVVTVGIGDHRRVVAGRSRSGNCVVSPGPAVMPLEVIVCLPAFSEDRTIAIVADRGLLVDRRDSHVEGSCEKVFDGRRCGVSPLSVTVTV